MGLMIAQAAATNHGMAQATRANVLHAHAPANMSHLSCLKETR